MSHTELSIARQASILANDWSEQMTGGIRDALKGAKRLAFVGTGTSYHAALWAHWLCLSFSKGKIKSRAATSWDELTNRLAGYADADETLIVVSHRGNRNLTRDLLSAAKRQRRILIAGAGAPTAKFPFIYSSPQETSQAHTMSFIGAMGALSELIATCLPAGAGAAARLRQERVAAAKLLEAAHKSFLASMSPIVEDPATKLHFVGAGPFHAIALELALKAREIAHLPAQGYGVEEILHGPFTSIEDDDALVLLRPAREPGKGLSRTLFTKRLDSCANAAEAIGTMTIVPRGPAPLVKRAASLDLCWQALVPLVWGQLFAVAQALHWSFDPDSNRQEDPRYKEVKQAAEYQA